MGPISECNGMWSVMLLLILLGNAQWEAVKKTEQAGSARPGGLWE